ncbi:hypothetical protein POVCU1_071460, partial [Plasmodium ovale curtisi]
MMNRNPTF